MYKSSIKKDLCEQGQCAADAGVGVVVLHVEQLRGQCRRGKEAQEEEATDTDVLVVLWAERKRYVRKNSELVLLKNNK